MHQKRSRWQLLASLIESGDTPACSVLTVTEIFAGMRSNEVALTSDAIESSYMAREPATGHQPPDPDKPPGYQPTTGRKLFMLILCVAGLIFVWAYYFLELRQH
jgi:hypothetical protein